MIEKRVQLSQIVRNQLPSYVREEFPLVSEFLSQYYKSQEYKGAPVDLIQNIDQYVKIDEMVDFSESTILLNDLDIVEDEIFVDLTLSSTGTNGFPNSYGLLKIGNEIITYTGKTNISFTGCIRGFSGITDLKKQNSPDELIFESSEAESHSAGDTIVNLSSIFLKEFLFKTKYQLLPGLHSRDLYSELNQALFIKQAKDFYKSKGTDESFSILFRALYGKDVSIIKPKDFLIKPSAANYKITQDLVVEALSGNPEDADTSVLVQDEYYNIQKAFSPIGDVQKILSKEGKVYYKISLDAGDADSVKFNSSVYGKFSAHPRTRLIGDINSSTTTLDVDSTLGFPDSGELRVTYSNQTEGVITYKSKSVNQFFECSGILSTIVDGSNIDLNTYAYAVLADESIVTFRITSVLETLSIPEKTSGFSSKEKIIINTLGSDLDDIRSQVWLTNISPTFEVKSLVLLDDSDKTYQINLSTAHSFKIGDQVIIVSNNGERKDSTVTAINSELSFVIRGQGDLPLINRYTIKRKILKTDSPNYENLYDVTSNVQNIYDLYKNPKRTLVASNSLPYYTNQPLLVTDRSVIFSGSFIGEDLQITTTSDHGFYTGDAVYYTPEKIETSSSFEDTITTTSVVVSSLFDEGIYYVKRVNSTTIKLANSKTNLYNGVFISIESLTEVTSNKVEYYKFKSKSLLPQKLYREFTDPIDDSFKYKTIPGYTGMFVNGVELLNYKSSDVVYYGKINSIDVTSSGSGYDILNPPRLLIEDPVGTGATGYCSVKGSLSEIKIVDPGFAYLDIPIIKISGGNGFGAVAEPNMTLISHLPQFNSESSTTVSLSNYTIGFSTYHKFINSEKIIYRTNGQKNISGLTTNSIYYVHVKSPLLVSLHQNEKDASIGINSVSMTSYGTGLHQLESYDKKSVISSINVLNSGANYENKKVTAQTSGIGTESNLITITNHGFLTNEIVTYTSTGTPIGGLTSNSNYYIVKISENNFKLSQTRNGDEIEFTSSGIGTHIFNYPEIVVEVSGKIGVSSISGETFKAQIQPVFRGQINSVHVSNNGVGYGSSEVINFNRQPLITLDSGSGAQVTPIISNGKIAQVLINSGGKNYTSPPNLTISGSGFGAVLTPIIENGRLVEIKIIQGGIGYDPKNTSITITSVGLGAKFDAKMDTWNINLFQKLYNFFNADDGILAESINQKYGLQYSHLYTSRNLRQILYSRNQDGKDLYGKTDLKKINGIEVSSTDHSPIIGWAYDGNPIYGPYGYIKKSGGTVVQLKSGYKQDFKENRPPLSIFPEGFFIEDYTHYESNDETVLDRRNGRFCVTPEFPNGVYAYFCTINDSADSSGRFAGYKKPAFPYVIGNEYKSKPNDFNFKRISNQEDLDINQTSWVRNTKKYNLIDETTQYEYVFIPNKLDQTANIKFAAPGFVERVGIFTGGNNYKIDDYLVFDNSNTGGSFAEAKVSKIEGKPITNISVATTTLSQVEVYPTSNKNIVKLLANAYHNLNNLDIIKISGVSTSSSNLEGVYNAGISTNKLYLRSGVGTVPYTGIVTHFSVFGDLSYPTIKENDILQIGTEKVKVLNIDSTYSRIRVLREVDGSVGSSHTATEILYEISKKIDINVGINTQYPYKVNKEIYFNPQESVGIGTRFGVGIGSTVSSVNPSGITSIFIPTKSIYLPNHGLETGDSVIYYTNGGQSIGVSTNGISTSLSITSGSTLFVAKIDNNLIGIATVKVGVGSTGTFVGITSTTSSQTTLFFTGIGTGVYHSFQTNYPKLTCKVTKNTVTVSTSQTHGLKTNDVAYVDVKPNSEITYTVEYNDYHRRLIVNPKTFISSGINTSDSTINIPSHGFVTGQKIIHTSSTPAGGLQDQKFYYIISIDPDNIRLSESYTNSIAPTPIHVGITSTSNGKISAVNPYITAYKNTKLIFDLSSNTLSYENQSTLYSAFELRFYVDSDLIDIFEKTNDGDDFEVERYGRVGISSDAKVVLSINENFPQKIYYNLVPVYENNIPEVKTQIYRDKQSVFNNEIQIRDSHYSGEQTIKTIPTSSSFTYDLQDYPESISYGSSTSIIKYQTDSNLAFGPIAEVSIINKGKNYYSLPGISTVFTKNGSGAILNIFSNSIGSIDKKTIKDIGFDFPTDYTIRPTASLPKIIKIESLASFKSIGISSFGRGYSIAPTLLVFDGKTNELVTDVDLRYSVGQNEVEILKNTYGINDVKPRILPIHNSNGVGISSIGYDSLTKNVTVTLSVGFSTANSFPFSVNDKVLIENISVGINSTGKGYNSEKYDYNLFTLTQVSENLGGIGTVTFSLDGLLSGSEYPGTFDALNSSGRIIPEKDFPIFNPILLKNNFVVGENIISNSSSGYVENWDYNTSTLKVISNQDFYAGDSIEGLSSNAKALISSVETYDAIFLTNSSSLVNNGWQDSVGFLNDNLQRVSDNEYYQNFSYSIKSQVEYDTWNDAVSALNHSVGFKKFSDYQLESSSPQGSMTVGLSTDVTSFEVSVDLEGVVDLNCVYDFDLVTENYKKSGSNLISDQISFSNRILTDYFESVGNRVLSIDDFSVEFNSNPRPSKFSEVRRFYLLDARAQKYVMYIRDKRYIDRRQLMLVSLIHDNTFGFMNQYGRVESSYDLGSFDFTIEGSEGIIQYYPTKFSVNDYDVTSLAYNIKDVLISTGGRNLGGIVDIDTSSVFVPSGGGTIISVPATYISIKGIVEVLGNENEYQFNEFNLVHDGADIQFIDYGQLTTSSLTVYNDSGIGTFRPYFAGSQLKVDFIPNSGIGATVNTIFVSMTDSSYSGIGTYDMKHARLEARSTSIASTSTPAPTVIADYPDNYDGAYLIVQVSDLTNNRHQLSEVTVVDDGSEVYFTEFANIETSTGIGTIGAIRSSTTQITFTPQPNIDISVKVYLNALRYEDDLKDTVSIDNTTIETYYGSYFGTERDVRKSFTLNHKTYPIFQRDFLGNSSDVVNLSENTIQLSNHFFVTGEELLYSHSGAGSTQAIGIANTSFVGVGTTNKLPSTVFAVKVNENYIRLARSAEDALLNVPKIVNLTSLGIGNSHTFTSTNQNSRVILALDNIIQSPVVSTALTSTLSVQATTVDDILYFSSGISSFFGGELIKVEEEIMKIESVGVGSTNAIRVQRPWLGTNISGYSTGAVVTKVTGNYNIVGNTINFVEAPYGNLPFSSTTNAPDDRDWVGISTGSSFQGRVFLRSGSPNVNYHTYSKNYIFDDISTQFDGSKRSFDLKSVGSDVTGISTENSVILINDVFQGPGLTYDYTLAETSGITSVRFTGTATSFRSDVNTSNLPVGGIIVSIGSIEGFGYQPLVSAGGTAVVSIAGTISSISIGNSGSGYRSGIQTVRVGVATSSVYTPNIEFIGTAIVSGGRVVSIAITNPGSGYTSTNPPLVVIDDPLSYSNIPLIYKSGYTGFGTEATVDIVVGAGSSVIDFEVKNNGYGYGQGDVLTIATGGSTGIPTTSSFVPFEISVQKTFSDKFTGWSLGELLVLDNLDDSFDGERISFPITLSDNIITIRASSGSNVIVEDTLLVFINDILQVPGEAYSFPGGSIITFKEAPKVGDRSKLLFYRGSGVIDVIERNILETVKKGDDLTIGYDASIGQSRILLEETRVVSSIDSTDLVSTNPYFGPGNVDDNTLVRPVTWCRQTEDKVIDGKDVAKDRILYEPVINPYAYVIQSVGIGSTTLYVDNLRPFFNQQNENSVALTFQNKITIISQNEKVGAYATAIVSTAGTVSSLSLVSGGVGYNTNPFVTLQSPVGLGTTQRASAIASISSLSGIVTSLSVVSGGSSYSQSHPPLVLIEPPTPDLETNDVTSYSGDSGFVVGFGITTITTQNYMIFDMYIPQNSYLRSQNLVGTAVTISALSPNDYFVIQNSNVGIASTAIISGRRDGSYIGVGTQYIDNVYQVDSSEIVYENISGIGLTYLKRVFCRIIGISSISFNSTFITFDSGIIKFDSSPGIGSTSYSGIITSSNYFGDFSWGRISLSFRNGDNYFNFYGENGVGGISTSAIVKRTSPLKYSDYIQ